MEPQEIKCYDNKKCCKCEKRVNCNCITTMIIVTLFAVAIGLLIGAAISATVLGNLAAFIVLAVVLFILLIVNIIFMVCKREKCC